jgi:hypothetical protein
MNTGANKTSDSEYGRQTQNEGEADTESIHNGVLDIGLDSPETRGDGSSVGNVDVRIGKR